ncbi:MAG: 5-oxo-L-prolinase, partial [Phycisphaerales bacterium]|nr:5-oxo-L-prolinase [Phycisphaerales bacterium]
MRFEKLSYVLALGLALATTACTRNQGVAANPSAAPAPVNDAPTAAVPDRPIQYRAADCHLHLVDFLQRTDGIRAALKAMDRCGVEDAVVSGMPLVKEWPQEERLRPEYYLEDDSRCYWYSATDVLVAREVQSLPPDQQ